MQPQTVELCAGIEVSARDAERGPEMKGQGADSVSIAAQKPEHTCSDVQVLASQITESDARG